MQTMYHPDPSVDLTLCVLELLVPNTGLWDVPRLKQTFMDEYASAVLWLNIEYHKQYFMELH